MIKGHSSISKCLILYSKLGTYNFISGYDNESDDPIGTLKRCDDCQVKFHEEVDEDGFYFEEGGRVTIQLLSPIKKEIKKKEYSRDSSTLTTGLNPLGRREY